jgi:Ca-activated chloride channel family protein
MRRLLAIVLAGTLGVAFACSTGSPAGPGTPGGSGATLTVLAGSELKDIEPLLPDLQRATGYRLQLSYVGSLDGAQRIVTGDRSQLAWFSSAKYLSLLQGGGSRIVAQQKIMLSPVVMGVKHSVATGFGWTNNPNVTWADIAARAKAGQLHFGMTNPAASNSGFVALVGVAEAFAQSGSALDAGTINSAALKDFFSGQSLTAGSSGFLATSYVRGQDSLDGMINYESVLLSLNQGSTLHEKLDVVYPKDGIVTADYPLMLLKSVRRDVYDKILAYLRRPDVQTRIMTTTNRRPAIPDVKPDSRFPSQVLIEMPFPASLDTINKLLFAYLEQVRKPDHAIFVLDTSGSMAGDRINNLKKALLGLTGSDTSITGQFAAFRQREELTFILFNNQVYKQADFTINNPDPNGADLSSVRDFVNSLQAGGGTAIYDAVYQAYTVAANGQRREPDRFFSIVLMTDGENNQGRDGNQFISDFKRLPTQTQQIKTFPILFGEGSPAQLQQLADISGGKVFDGKSAPISEVFKEIRGYQ